MGFFNWIGKRKIATDMGPKERFIPREQLEPRKTDQWLVTQEAGKDGGGCIQAKLWLTEKRHVLLFAPLVVTHEELERILRWIALQVNVVKPGPTKDGTWVRKDGTPTNEPPP